MGKTYYFKTYDATRAKYDKLRAEGKQVVLKLAINGRKMYRVKVL